jgi:glycosyltransferase involved in cell wall biosynthesis
MIDAKPDVIHVVGSLDGGGAERLLRELAPRLVARGVRTEIVCSYDPRIAGDAFRTLGCTVHHRQKRRGFDPAHFAWLIGVLAQRRPSIVHTHQWTGKYAGRAAAIAARVPIIVHTEHSPLPIGRTERFMAELLWRRTDSVITFTQHIVDLLQAREPVRRVELIRNGVAIPPAPPSAQERMLAREAIGAPHETIVFGSVASLQPRKNHELALEALARIPREELPRTRLDIFGEGHWREHLVERAQALRVEDRVVFHGFRPDVRELLPAIDVFVSVATLELAPISMLEAMARALPIIGAPHPGTLEMVEPEVSGAVVDWDVEELAASMRRARDDAEWRARCGANGRARAMRDYDIEKTADLHVEVYSRLLAQHGQRRIERANPSMHPHPTYD